MVGDGGGWNGKDGKSFQQKKRMPGDRESGIRMIFICFENADLLWFRKKILCM